MVSFRLNEIPDGVSEEKLSLDAEELDIELSDIKRVTLQLKFNKQNDSLRIECHITAEVTFTCDRSLDLFHTELYSDYEVVFQSNAENEKEELSGTLRRLDSSQNVIDITKELRDTVLLSVPIKKLHPRYYKDGDVTDFNATYGEAEKEHDPRWDELAKLKQNIQKN